MLQIYRRHTSACKGKYRQHDRSGKDCTCVIRVEGMCGRWVRESTKTRSWRQAEAMVKLAEKRGSWDIVEEATPETPANIPTEKLSISDAVDTFIKHKRKKSGGNLLKVAVGKYNTTLLRLRDFAGASVPIDQVDLPVLTSFQDQFEDRGIGASVTAHYITRLRTFGKFCVKRGWWTKNYALDLEFPENYDYTERVPRLATKTRTRCSGFARQHTKLNLTRSSRLTILNWKHSSK